MSNINVVSVDKSKQVPTRDVVLHVLVQELQAQMSGPVHLSASAAKKLLSERGVLINAKELINHVNSKIK